MYDTDAENFHVAPKTTADLALGFVPEFERAL